MENFLPKRESGLSKVVGGSEQSQKETHEKYKNAFLNQLTYEVEKEKSLEELEIIKAILEKIPDFIR